MDDGFTHDTIPTVFESRPFVGLHREPRQVGPLQKWRMKRVIEFVDAHLGQRITLHTMAAAAGLTRMHFAAQFRTASGLRPHEYLLRRRVDRACELLRDSQLPLVEIALSVGFQTQAHFTTVFRRFTGETPSRWRGPIRAPP
jgi:AraC family transcriptional regulator